MNGYAMEVFAEEQVRERLKDAENRRLLREAAATRESEPSGGLPWRAKFTLAIRRLARATEAS